MSFVICVGWSCKYVKIFWRKNFREVQNIFSVSNYIRCCFSYFRFHPFCKLSSILLLTVWAEVSTLLFVSGTRMDGRIRGLLPFHSWSCTQRVRIKRFTHKPLHQMTRGTILACWKMIPLYMHIRYNWEFLVSFNIRITYVLKFIYFTKYLAYQKNGTICI